MIHNARMHISTNVDSMTYIEVPESKRGDDHGSGSSVFPITAVEDKSRAGVLTKTALHCL